MAQEPASPVPSGAAPEMTNYLCGERRPTERICLHEMFLRTADRYPNREAVVSASERMTYAELAEKSGRLASYLRFIGVVSNTPVGLMCGRHPAMLVGMLGILRAGGAYVPLDPSFPEARLAMILSDCRPLVVVTLREYRDRVGKMSKLVALDHDWSAVQRHEVISSASGERFDGDIYVIYTSGSTGRPKGIVQTHAALSNLIQWQTEASGIDHSGTVLQFSSVCFDVHLQEIFGAFSSGGRVCMLEEEDRFDPRRLFAVMREFNVTVAFLPVSILAALFSTEEQVQGAPPSLREIITAGEQPLIGAVLKRYLQANSHVRLHNHYGVSESHVVTAQTMSAASKLPDRPNIGGPIANTNLLILNDAGQPAAVGEIGEVWIAGICLAREYLNDPERTANSFRKIGDERYFKSNDLVRVLPGGELDFVGRRDDQLKIRGSLVEPGDVEAAMLTLPGIQQCVVGARPSPNHGLRLIAWYVAAADISDDVLRSQLAEILPDYLMPSAFVHLGQFPTGPTGKVDRRMLPTPSLERPRLNKQFHAASTVMEHRIERVLASVVGLNSLGIDDNFFDLGATSLLLAKAALELSRELGQTVNVIDFFEFTTIRRLSQKLSTDGSPTEANYGSARSAKVGAPAWFGERPEIAIVGMSGRFAGVGSVAELWTALMEGRECLVDVDEADLTKSMNLPQSGSLERRITHLGPIDHADCFDADFFGFNRTDAAWMDPQHRVFLECAWHALEDAGCSLDRDRKIGVFAGCELNSYFMHVRPHIRSMGDYLHAVSLNDKDFLTSRVAYKLGLRGPAVTVQTACSTSLVAVHLAVQSILNRECKLALAGGVSLQVPGQTPHFYEESLIFSRDGRTRPFSASADGTNITSGVGLVVLKPLAAALRDRDRVYAVIVGTAINNDGERKAGYSAPSVEGQVEAIGEVLRRARLTATDLDFVEAHGTATEIGDLVEVTALAEVFRRDTDRRNFCALGSIKANVGHLNRAAGVAGLIRSALSVYHGLVPPLLHFLEPNARLEVEKGPFFFPRVATPLNLECEKWRGMVSSFGLGGTNAHAIVESPPRGSTTPLDSSKNQPAIVVLSAKTHGALGQTAASLRDALAAEPKLQLEDIAFTAGCGRTALEYRAVRVASTVESLRIGLQAVATAPEKHSRKSHETAAVFMFPGHGAQTLGLGRQLHRDFLPFREAFDAGAALLQEITGVDVRHCLTAESGDVQAREILSSNVVGPAYLVIVERAHAMLLLEWGVRPAAMVGLSTGDYAAACLAGVLSLEQCLDLLVQRGRLMDELAPAGGLVSILTSPDQAKQYEGDGLYLAAANSRGHAVIGGTLAALARLETRLVREGASFARLPNRSPNHCELMDPICRPFAEKVRQMKMGKLQIPYVSSSTGDWVTQAIVEDPQHWAGHVRNPVLFAQALDRLKESGYNTFLEIGPRDSLCKLVRYHFLGEVNLTPIPFLPASEESAETESFLEALGSYWSEGGEVDWRSFYRQRTGHVVSLVSYPFQRTRHALPLPGGESTPDERSAARQLSEEDWFYLRKWMRRAWPIPYRAGDFQGDPRRWLLVRGLGQDSPGLAGKLRAEGAAVLELIGAEGWRPISDFSAEIDLTNEACLGRCVEWLRRREPRPNAVVFDWASLSRGSELPRNESTVGPMSLLCRFLKVIRPYLDPTLEWWLFTENGLRTEDGEHVKLSQVGIEAFRLIVRQEDFSICCFQRDVAAGGIEPFEREAFLLGELLHPEPEGLVALRRGQRLTPTYERTEVAAQDSATSSPFAQGACYLIVGGLGPVGYAIARHLLGVCGCRVAIVGRSVFAEMEDVRQDRLQALQASGATFSYHTGDVCDMDAMRSALREIERRHGRVRGVIHAAASIGEGDFLHFLADLTPAELGRQMAPKWSGIKIIDAVFAHASLDFRVAFSSISTILGGIGYGAYAMGNLLLAEGAAALQGGKWAVIDWDVWDSEGNARGQQVPLGSSAKDLAMGTDAAIRALERILRSRFDRVWVSTTEIQERMRAAQEVGLERTESPAANKSTHPEAEPDGTAADEVERAAAASWKAVLGVNEVASDTAFTSYGGDSLSAIRVILMLNKQLNLLLVPQDMLRAPTFKDFCQKVRAQIGRRNSRLEESAGEVSCKPSGSDSPISALQERWLEMEARGFGYLDMPVVIHGELDVEVLTAAIIEVVRRHQVLHSVFPQQPSGLVSQVPLMNWRPTIGCTDFRSETPASRRRLLLKLRRRQDQVRFDLAKAPAFSAGIYRLSEGRTLLYIRVHHIVFDGWSASLFIEDLDRIYQTLARGHSLALLPQPPQYREFAEWHRDHLAGDGLAKARAYWTAAFEGFPGVCRLTKSTAVESEARGARKKVVVIDQATVERLERTAAERGDTLFVLLVAAWALALSRTFSHTKLILGTTTAGRYRPRTDEMIGVFVNPLPMRLTLDDPEDLEGHLARVREMLDAVQTHQAYVLRDLVQRVPPFVGSDLNETFRAYILFQNYQGLPKALAARYEILDCDGVIEDQELEALAYESVDLMRDIELIIFPAEPPRGLFLNLWYRCAEIGESEATTCLARFQEYLEKLAPR